MCVPLVCVDVCSSSILRVSDVTAVYGWRELCCASAVFVKQSILCRYFTASLCYSALPTPPHSQSEGGWGDRVHCERPLELTAYPLFLHWVVPIFLQCYWWVELNNWGVGMRWGWEGLPSVSLDCPNSRCTAIRIFLMVDAGWCTLHLKSTEGPLLKNCNDFFVFINNLYKTINCYHHSNPIIHHHCNLVIIIAILSSSLLPYHHHYCKPANLRFSALNRPCLRFVFGSCWPVVIVIYCCLLLLLFVISAVVCTS